jgi:hypothetical protein
MVYTRMGVSDLLTDLPVIWPIAGTERPECWPDATSTVWHVLDIRNEQSFGVAVLALQTDGRTASD